MVTVDRRAVTALELIQAMDLARELTDAGRVQRADLQRVVDAIAAYDEAREETPDARPS